MEIIKQITKVRQILLWKKRKTMTATGNKGETWNKTCILKMYQTDYYMKLNAGKVKTKVETYF